MKRAVGQKTTLGNILGDSACFRQRMLALKNQVLVNHDRIVSNRLSHRVFSHSALFAALT